MVKLTPTLSVSLLPPHERVVEHACQTCFGCTSPHGLDRQTTSGFHRTLSRPGWPDFVFAFHDTDEIGPRMLARIAKRTGLSPEDL